MRINYLKIKSYLKDTLQDVIAIYTEKGAEPFKKPLVVFLLFIIGSYIFYNTSRSRLVETEEKLNWLRSVKGYYNDYIAATDLLKRYSKKFPAWKDKDEFLNYTLTTVASRNGIIFSSVEAQKEMVYDKIYHVTKQVRFVTTFEKLLKFLAEIELSEVFVEIFQIKLTKKEGVDQIGLIEVDLTVGTIFIKL